jgi:hypothetical protein
LRSRDFTGDFIGLVFSDPISSGMISPDWIRHGSDLAVLARMSGFRIEARHVHLQALDDLLAP